MSTPPSSSAHHASVERRPRGEIAVLFARALDGDEAAELELGYRAFPLLPGGAGGPADENALQAHLALTRTGFHHRQAVQWANPVTDQWVAAAREAFVARVVAEVAARRHLMMRAVGR